MRSVFSTPFENVGQDVRNSLSTMAPGLFNPAGGALRGRIDVSFLDLALAEVVTSILADRNEGSLPAILVGSTDLLPVGYLREASSMSASRVMQFFKGLIGHGARQEVKQPWADAYRDHLASSCTAILLPYQVAPGDVVLFECNFKGQYAPSLQLFDPSCRYAADIAASQVPELNKLASLIFRGDADVRLNIKRPPRAPLPPAPQPTYLGKANSVGAVFYMVASRVEGNLPRLPKVDDDGAITNFMWACVAQGKLLPVPMVKFKV